MSNLYFVVWQETQHGEINEQEIKVCVQDEAYDFVDKLRNRIWKGENIDYIFLTGIELERSWDGEVK